LHPLLTQASTRAVWPPQAALPCPHHGSPHLSSPGTGYNNAASTGTSSRQALPSWALGAAKGFPVPIPVSSTSARPGATSGRSQQGTCQGTVTAWLPLRCGKGVLGDGQGGGGCAPGLAQWGPQHFTASSSEPGENRLRNESKLWRETRQRAVLGQGELGLSLPPPSWQPPKLLRPPASPGASELGHPMPRDLHRFWLCPREDNFLSVPSQHFPRSLF